MSCQSVSNFNKNTLMMTFTAYQYRRWCTNCFFDTKTVWFIVACSCQCDSIAVNRDMSRKPHTLIIDNICSKIVIKPFAEVVTSSFWIWKRAHSDPTRQCFNTCLPDYQAKMIMNWNSTVNSFQFLLFFFRRITAP